MWRFKHLEETGQGYTEHGTAALGLAWSCLRAASICVIHAAYPDLGGISASSVLRKALDELDAAGAGAEKKEE